MRRWIIACICLLILVTTQVHPHTSPQVELSTRVSEQKLERDPAPYVFPKGQPDQAAVLKYLSVLHYLAGLSLTHSGSTSHSVSASSLRRSYVSHPVYSSPALTSGFVCPYPHAAQTTAVLAWNPILAKYSWSVYEMDLIMCNESGGDPNAVNGGGAAYAGGPACNLLQDLPCPGPMTGAEAIDYSFNQKYLPCRCYSAWGR